MKKIRIAVMGYGNLGRGVELALKQTPDMELVGIFSRREPSTLRPVFAESKVFRSDDILSMKNDIDVLILCGGSKSDLMTQSVQYAADFNVVDSFDTHAKIPEHLVAVGNATQKNGTVAIVSVGWDPGLFSLQRLLAESILPFGKTYTFWGKGVSQGHSDAVRRIEGVKMAVQYTVPVEAALDGVRGKNPPEYTTRQKHTRKCFVVALEGADKEKIREQIVTMPDYFADYDTEVDFISEAEFLKNHTKMPHGGLVIHNGETGREYEHSEIYEFSLKLDSNPEFTAGVLVAYARAAYRLAEEGQSGVRTILEIPPYLISPRSLGSLQKELL